MNFIPILGYHRIVPGERKGQYELTQLEFERHLELFIQNGLKSITYESFLNEKNNPQSLLSGSLMITFDDGYSSDFHIVYPLLRQIGFLATFFITVNFVNQPGYLSWDEIRELSAMGMSIQSHSFNHVFLSHLNRTQMIDELKRSKETLEEAIHKKVPYIAVPGGRVSNEVIRTAYEVGYQGIYTSQPGFRIHYFQNMPILKRFIVKNSYLPETILKISKKDPGVNLKMNCIYTAKRIVRIIFGDKRRYV